MDIDYEADLADKLAKNEQLWEALAPRAEAGVEFNLVFFFYADSKAGNACLLLKLNEVGYRAKSERRGGLFGRTWAVTGSTPPMGLSRDGVDIWTRHMVAVARACDAQFDGWGTALL